MMLIHVLVLLLCVLAAGPTWIHAFRVSFYTDPLCTVGDTTYDISLPYNAQGAVNQCFSDPQSNNNGGSALISCQPAGGNQTYFSEGFVRFYSDCTGGVPASTFGFYAVQRTCNLPNITSGIVSLSGNPRYVVFDCSSAHSIHLLSWWVLGSALLFGMIFQC